MPTPIRETALAAIATRLTAQITTATVERARRAPVDTDKETLPRLVLTGGDMTPDHTAEPGMTHHTLAFDVTGYVRATSDLALEHALSALHAQVVASLEGWQPSADGISEATEQGAAFELYPADESDKPAGLFTATFSILCIAPTGDPYTA